VNAKFNGNFNVRKVSAGQIQRVELQPKGQKGIGILVGALSGLATGITIDVLINKNNDFDYSDFSKGVGAIVRLSIRCIRD
jgi:hypothetical protein